MASLLDIAINPRIQTLTYTVIGCGSVFLSVFFYVITVAQRMWFTCLHKIYIDLKWQGMGHWRRTVFIRRLDGPLGENSTYRGIRHWYRMKMFWICMYLSTRHLACTRLSFRLQVFVCWLCKTYKLVLFIYSVCVSYYNGCDSSTYLRRCQPGSSNQDEVLITVSILPLLVVFIQCLVNFTKLSRLV